MKQKKITFVFWKKIDNSKLNKNNKNEYYQTIADQEYNIINSFITSDSEEEEKVDKNDTEWSNTSLKSAKRKPTQKLASKKTTKFNQKMFCPENKKLFDPKLHQIGTSGPIKKKRGRKPKFSLENNQFTNDENKTFAPQQQQTSLGNPQSNIYHTNDTLQDPNNNKIYQKICGNSISISSASSSRRTSDTSTLSATSDDEIFESKQSESVSKQHNLVLMEDSSVLNQSSDVNKVCKKMKPATKKTNQPKKRNSKSNTSTSGPVTGINFYSLIKRLKYI